MLGNHYIDTVVTAFELVAQNLTLKDSSSPRHHARLGASTACWDACRDVVGATVTGIDYTPLNMDWRRWLGAANWSGLTAVLGFVVKQTGIDRRCHRRCNDRDCHASDYESF